MIIFYQICAKYLSGINGDMKIYINENTYIITTTEGKHSSVRMHSLVEFLVPSGQH